MEIRMIVNAGKTPQVFILESARDRLIDKEKAIYEAIDELERLLQSIKNEDREG